MRWGADMHLDKCPIDASAALEWFDRHSDALSERDDDAVTSIFRERILLLYAAKGRTIGQLAQHLATVFEDEPNIPALFSLWELKALIEEYGEEYDTLF